MYRVAIITASDKGYAGERVDESGPLLKQMAENAGFAVSGITLLSDDFDKLSRAIATICDDGLADLILTTGGTGFSPRDCMPEVTIAVCERLTPGIPEAMRLASMGITNRAMLSRAQAGIRGRTLIINLPGSPKAARENLEAIIDALPHGLEMLCGAGSADCADPNPVK